jgi:DNA-binding NarL/FixJ family response regulator
VNSPLPIRATALRRPRVAVVDDDRPLVEVLDEALRGDGFDVLTCQRWEGAYQQIRNGRPDVVLLDLRMGGAETGWRVLDLLLLDPVTRDIPVILCSALVDSIEARKPALRPEYGIRVLPKPFDLAALEDCLRQALQPRQLQQAEAAETACPHGQRNRLTAREQEVASLIARGYSNNRIADALVITPGTVANHVARIMERLGMQNRSQIAAWAVRYGVVQGEILEVY